MFTVGKYNSARFTLSTKAAIQRDVQNPKALNRKYRRPDEGAYAITGKGGGTDQARRGRRFAPFVSKRTV